VAKKLYGLTAKDVAGLKKMAKRFGAGHTPLSRRPVPTRRRHIAGGGGTTLRFGLTEEIIPAAEGLAVADAGLGDVQLVDDGGDDIGTVECKNRYFDIIPANSVVWIDDNNFIINVGCTIAD